MGPGDLAKLLEGLPVSRHPDLLVPAELGADAGVLRVAPDLAIVQSADFFPPMIADARNFGRIAAANALSDIYALGARPVSAINLLAVPSGEPVERVRAMLIGAHEVITQAGAVSLGGHTLIDTPLKFGLSVTGVVHPNRIVRHNTLAVGHVLVLTKPLGTAVVVTAAGRGMVPPEELAACIDRMCVLNAAPSSLMFELGASACTDVTGFGLLGHLLEMLSLGKAGAVLQAGAIPLLPNVLRYAAEGAACGGTKRNMEYTSARVDYGPRGDDMRVVLNDAQTSGGLLIALPSEGAASMLHALSEEGYPCQAAIIGNVVAEHPGMLVVMP
jgi:selenide,water dikinase